MASLHTYIQGEVIEEGHLKGWRKGSFTAGPYTRETYRRPPSGTPEGGARCVIIIHEIPGLHPRVIQFANTVVKKGFEVIMPSLLGTPGQAVTAWYTATSMVKLCISKEFTWWATKKRSPIVTYLRALAKFMHGECGGPGVGVVGMCFSGGFALGMMVREEGEADDGGVGPVAAPVLSQPSLPFAVGAARSADLSLSIEDLDQVKTICARGCMVRGYQYEKDFLVGTRFATLKKALGEDNFLGFKFPGCCKHSVLAGGDGVYGPVATADVVAFFKKQLLGEGEVEAQEAQAAGSGGAAPS